MMAYLVDDRLRAERCTLVGHVVGELALVTHALLIQDVGHGPLDGVQTHVPDDRPHPGDKHPRPARKGWVETQDQDTSLNSRRCPAAALGATARKTRKVGVGIEVELRQRKKSKEVKHKVEKG